MGHVWIPVHLVRHLNWIMGTSVDALEILAGQIVKVKLTPPTLINPNILKINAQYNYFPRHIPPS